MRDGVRVINCARGELIDDAALKQALDAGKVAGAALDVFPSEPITDYPLFAGYENVVVTPHLGASTLEAQDRAGVQTAEQVVAALTGGVVSTAVNIPAISAEDMDVLGPFIPLVDRLGRLASTLAPGVDRIETEYFGRIAERDTRLLTLAVLQGVLGGHCEEDVNLVNAPSLAERARHRRLRAHRGGRARLLRPRPDHDRMRGGSLPRGGHDARPPAPAAPARGLGSALQPPARRGRPPGAVPLPQPTGHARPGRQPARRPRDQHLERDAGRPALSRRSQRGDRRDRHRHPGRGDARRSSPSRACSTAARCESDALSPRPRARGARSAGRTAPGATRPG